MSDEKKFIWHDEKKFIWQKGPTDEPYEYDAASKEEDRQTMLALLDWLSRRKFSNPGQREMDAAVIVAAAVDTIALDLAREVNERIPVPPVAVAPPAPVDTVKTAAINIKTEAQIQTADGSTAT